MIGTRAALSAGVAVLGLAAVAGPYAADPAVEVGAERLVLERATRAVAVLDALRQAAQPGLDAARGAAAAVLSGEDPPGRGLQEAATLIAGAEVGVAPARRALAELSAARSAWRPDTSPLPAPIATGALGSIAEQLRAAGPAADAFADHRRRAVGLPGTLEEALRAMDRGSIDEADRLVARTRADHEAILAWETDLPTLPVWIETTDAMISSVESILAATRAGDGATARAAAAQFAALGEEAATADRALRIALGEGGSALTAAPLERLAAAVRAIEAARSAAAAILAQARA
ncbi:MAG: hypothetical protein M3153_04650 [Chloroflexota bacterium]|nr:hypothetical protein [Chloroflexota bacterium]